MNPNQDLINQKKERLENLKITLARTEEQIARFEDEIKSLKEQIKLLKEDNKNRLILDPMDEGSINGIILTNGIRRQGLVIYTKEQQGDNRKGQKLSGHQASLFLNSCRGQWYTMDGTPLYGYLYFKPKEDQNNQIEE